MLSRLRTESWRRRGAWLRGIGVAVLLVGFFAPLAGAVAVALTAAGLLLFLVGAITWLARDTEPWLRRG